MIIIIIIIIIMIIIIIININMKYTSKYNASTHCSFSPGNSETIRLVSQLMGDLNISFPSLGCFAPNPSTNLITSLRRVSFRGVNSSFPPEPSVAEVHLAALFSD